ncbi:hypothetical protein GLOIN_2v1783661 [Rhizophagus irregularis DAOM 181602=DAOM 197198]|nr:hypothetical protein GLOIN_2v1783661 [Rhizophagus irregularis DAOM 181602=DAOM 197198]
MIIWLDDVALAVSPIDDYGSPLFGKQLLVQASRGTCSIVHWISPDCESSPGDLIRLSPCPGCAAHTPLPPSKKQNADLTLCTPTVFFTTFAYFADHQ